MPRTDIKKRIKDDVIIDERIQILRFRQKAEIIIHKVCKGEFPGDYS